MRDSPVCVLAARIGALNFRDGRRGTAEVGWAERFRAIS